ncbi:MAG TPA: Stp1/IreP family PP2C-type Ser/Thr phosphatase [Ktedonobacteraceae bacterium]|nr:Stp1/IreP family PP2C-type Ser/Thr phosphatase [Ktedonobacteraceae bacterium]
MSKQLRLDPAQLTDVGRKRPHNEDNMAYVIPKDPEVMARKGALFIVADGMGGHAAGEVASEIAVDTVSNVYYQDDSEDVPVALLRAIKRANALIYQRAAENMLRSGMGTTCVAAVLRGKIAYIANVGDSRAYLIRAGQAVQISQDHSWVAEQVRAGLLTEDQARSHAQRNVITRCLGTQPDVEIDVFPVELQESDSLVLCTDGLSGLISDEELRTIVDQHQPQESVYLLVERANENGGPDNITAIVVRVQEVGTDPPEVRHPVYAGGMGGIVGDDTLPMGLAPAQSSSRPLQIEDGRTPSAPLPHLTNPLPPPERITAPQPVLRIPPWRRSRLFYPTLALFVLLLASFVGGGFYYLFYKDVENKLGQADTLIRTANQEVQSNPVAALHTLLQAQSTLREVQARSLTEQQRQRMSALLNGSLLVAVQRAMRQYNQTYNITALPCSTTVVGAINLGSTNTQVDSIASITDGKGNLLSYALGTDHKLYQLSPLPNNQHSLLNPFTTLGLVLKIAGNGSRLLALVEQPAVGGAAAKYSLHLLTPTNTGLLQDSSEFTIDAKQAQGISIPVLITPSDADAYVLLSSAASPNTVTILDVAASMQHNVVVMRQVGSATLSISTSIVSVAAFPAHQLFLLFSDGSVQSLSFVSGNPKLESVLIQQPIAPSLPLAPNEFAPTLTVPTVNALAQSQSFLSVSQASLLLAGIVEGTPHLYLVDGLYHRVLDLQWLPSSPPSSTPTGSATPATRTSTTGGATSAGGVMMRLLAQYSSARLLAEVKSLVVNPKQAQLSLLTHGSQDALLSIDVSQKTPCGT